MSPRSAERERPLEGVCVQRQYIYTQGEAELIGETDDERVVIALVSRLESNIINTGGLIDAVFLPHNQDAIKTQSANPLSFDRFFFDEGVAMVEEREREKS